MKLKQVLINILGNAVKFTEAPGTVAFTAEQLPGEEGLPGALRFTVRDTGIGMDPEFIPKIFESFTQENATAANRYGGSGLGMAITRNFVEMMGGRIEVESKKGAGSVFTVTVPMQPSDRTAQPAAMTDWKEGLSGSLAGRRVLMAEDVEQNAEILADLLELEEMESERAENGEEALRMFREHPEGYYDCILMDVRMPVMDGLTAAKAIRALPRADAETIPIIAMTANVFDEDMERSLAAGMNAHLSKPIEPDLMYETIARLLAGLE
jgi:CheY-like chemotaxis protein